MNVSALSDVGKLRTANQDCIFVSQVPIGKFENLFIVADGMGGHKAGDTAARCAVDAVVNVVKSNENNSILGVLDIAVRRANDEVMQLAGTSEDYQGMGTTLVLATISDGMLSVANVGDSRLYSVNEEIRQITRDHSLVEEMVSIGELGRDEARTHSNKNIITRAIGGDAKVMADFFEVRINPGDKFLLCSDGLTNMVEDETIKQIVMNNSCQEAATTLVDLANANGGRDNISVIIIEP